MRQVAAALTAAKDDSRAHERVVKQMKDMQAAHASAQNTSEANSERR